MSRGTEYFFGAEKERYLTKGVSSRMPAEYIFLMWQWIDCLVLEKSPDVDYLQIFTFSVINEGDKLYQRITHSQELPEYKETYQLEVMGEGITGKVFVIDDSVQCTMLWDEEY